MAAVVEALARNKVVALLVPTGRMDTRDIAALSLSERLGAYAGERLASAAQAVELGEFLKAALFGGTIVLVERERRHAQRVRAVGAKGDVGIAGVVWNAAEIYAAGAVEIWVFHFVDGGGGTVRGGTVPLVLVAVDSEPSPESSELAVPDSSRATRSASSSVRLGLSFCFSARAVACSSLCGDNNLGAPSSDPVNNANPSTTAVPMESTCL